MDNEKYVTWKTHKKENHYTMVSKLIYPVALNPIDIRDSCNHEVNIRNIEHCSWRSKYEFKDVTFKRSSFKNWGC